MSATHQNRSKRARLARAMRRSGLLELLLRAPSWRGTIVLSYHRIGDPAESGLYRRVFAGPQEDFDAQLRLLTRHFDVVEPSAFPAGGRGRQVMLSFDDGYRDVYELAAPVLAAHGVRVALFLCSGFIDGTASAWWDEAAWMIRRASVGALPPGPWSEQPLPLDGEVAIETTIDAVVGAIWAAPTTAVEGWLDRLADATGAGRRPVAQTRSDWLTWDMARALQRAGHRIGAHTASHPILARLPASEQEREIVAGAARIAQELGVPVDWFAYPVGLPGTYDATTTRAVLASGMRLAFMNRPGRIVAVDRAAHELPRLPAESLRDPDVFAATLALPGVFLR